MTEHDENQPRPSAAQQFDEARIVMRAEAVVRDADPIPGAYTEHEAIKLSRTIVGYSLARSNLRAALKNLTDDDSPNAHDYFHQRNEEHTAARTFLKTDVIALLAHLDDEDGEDDGR